MIPTSDGTVPNTGAEVAPVTTGDALANLPAVSSEFNSGSIMYDTVGPNTPAASPSRVSLLYGSEAPAVEPPAQEAPPSAQVTDVHQLPQGPPQAAPPPPAPIQQAPQAPTNEYDANAVVWHNYALQNQLRQMEQSQREWQQFNEYLRQNPQAVEAIANALQPGRPAPAPDPAAPPQASSSAPPPQQQAPPPQQQGAQLPPEVLNRLQYLETRTREQDYFREIDRLSRKHGNNFDPQAVVAWALASDRPDLQANLENAYFDLDARARHNELPPQFAGWVQQRYGQYQQQQYAQQQAQPPQQIRPVLTAVPPQSTARVEPPRARTGLPPAAPPPTNNGPRSMNDVVGPALQRYLRMQGHSA